MFTTQDKLSFSGIIIFVWEPVLKFKELMESWTLVNRISAFKFHLMLLLAWSKDVILSL